MCKEEYSCSNRQTTSTGRGKATAALPSSNNKIARRQPEAKGGRGRDMKEAGARSGQRIPLKMRLPYWHGTGQPLKARYAGQRPVDVSYRGV
jgi:hypothetical protein